VDASLMSSWLHESGIDIIRVHKDPLLLMLV
jgi:hypothetical protein